MIVLHGALGQSCGYRHDVRVATGLEAIRYLIYSVEGFREQLSRGLYEIRINETAVPIEGLILPIHNHEFHIAPVLAGSGKGVGMGLMGAALIAVGVASGGSLFAAGFGGGWAGTAIGFGVAFALGGIAQMMTPELQTSDLNKSSKSYLFGGGINSTKAGGCLPVVYGQRVRVGSQVIATDIVVEA